MPDKQAKESLSEAQMQVTANLNHVKAGYIQPNLDEVRDFFTLPLAVNLLKVKSFIERRAPIFPV